MSAVCVQPCKCALCAMLRAVQEMRWQNAQWKVDEQIERALMELKGQPMPRYKSITEVIDENREKFTE